MLRYRANYRQCVAKNNTISFYIFLAAITLFLIALEVGAMSSAMNKTSVNHEDKSALLSLLRPSARAILGLRK